MRVTVKGRKLLNEHIWFEQFKTAKEIISGSDSVTVHANKAPLNGKAKKQLTLITELNKTEAEIFGAFNSTVRNEIRRAEKDGVEIKVYNSLYLKEKNGVLDAFSDTYRNMYAEKGLDRTLPLSEIQAYIENGCFLLTAAIIDGKPCVYHSYVFDSDNARLLHSCSEFRVKGGVERNAIGRANRLLHLKDMLYFKTAAVKEYDWGGVSSFASPNGIDKFKMSFCGKEAEYFNCVINKTFKSRVIVFVGKILGKKR